MNKARRNKIAAIAAQLKMIVMDLDMLQDEEQEAFDNLPENFHGSEKGEMMEGMIEHLAECSDDITRVSDHLTDLANDEAT